MRRLKNGIVLMLLSIVVLGCGNKKQPPPLITVGTADDWFLDSKIVEIPFVEEKGVKNVKANINGLVVDMVFDTGCSGLLISVDEVLYLASKGLIEEKDILGFSNSVIADGSVMENMVVNIKKLVIGDEIECENVRATVCPNSGVSLLLGNEVIDRVKKCEIDNANKVIIFYLY